MNKPADVKLPYVFLGVKTLFWQISKWIFDRMQVYYDERILLAIETVN